MDLLKFLLRLPFTLIKGLFRALVFIFGLLGRVIKPVVGNIDWRAPVWWTAMSGGLKRGFARMEGGVDKYPKAISLIILVLLCVAGAGVYGYHWGLTRPRPINPPPMVYKEPSVRVSGRKALTNAPKKPPPRQVTFYFKN